MGVVLKRAKYFITCGGKYFMDKNILNKDIIERNLILDEPKEKKSSKIEQLSLFS